MKKDVMLDLETWGNRPYCVVVQVGISEFDRETGVIGQLLAAHIDAASEMQRNFRVDADTLYWWLSQDKNAQIAAMGGKLSRMQSKVVWTQVNDFLEDAENIWCHASFDAAIVNEHLRMWGIKPKFKYWAFKDLRTLVEIAEIDTRPYKARSAGVRIEHNALDDCAIQVAYCVDAMKKLKIANVRKEEGV